MSTAFMSAVRLGLLAVVICFTLSMAGGIAYSLYEGLSAKALVTGDTLILMLRFSLAVGAVVGELRFGWWLLPNAWRRLRDAWNDVG